MSPTASKKTGSQKTYREIRRTFEQNLPGMFGGSDTIREYLARVEGKVPSGTTAHHHKAYETSFGEAAFASLANAAIKVTKTGKFKPRDIVDAVEDWLMDKQFISPGGGARRFCGHLWLLVAVDGSMKGKTSLKFLEFLAGADSLDWRARWVAAAAFNERKKNDRLPESEPDEWLRGEGYDRIFSENPQVLARYQERGGYSYSLKHHRTLIRSNSSGLAGKEPKAERRS
jgi:hypothetical protein